MYQIYNEAAKQEREKGYCEIVLKAQNGLPALGKTMASFAVDYPSLVDPKFLSDSEKILRSLEET
jgi:hypothetical protein